jgi:hypothetical protein
VEGVPEELEDCLVQILQAAAVEEEQDVLQVAAVLEDQTQH